MRRVEQSHVIIKSMQTSTGSLMRQQAKKTAYITLTDHNTLWGGEMTDYSDLVKRLREHAENMYVDFLNEAADAIELLQRELKCATELWEQQKELALEYLKALEGE